MVNYEENTPSATNAENDLLETYTDSIQNVETVHRADELGNIYLDSSENFINSEVDTIVDTADNYDSYITDYTFDNQIGDSSRLEPNGETNDRNEPDELKDSMVMPDMSDFQQGDTNYDCQTAEDMLMSEREREKKSKKELEEEEREKMQ